MNLERIHEVAEAELLGKRSHAGQKPERGAGNQATDEGGYRHEP